MNTTASKLFSPLTLPNGQTIPNRLCKAAMEENLSDEGQLPGDRLFRLYSSWAKGGAGLVELSGGSYESPAMQGRTTEKEDEKPASGVRWPKKHWKKTVTVLAITKVQLNRLAQGKTPKANVSPLFSLIGDQIKTKKRTKRYRRWRESTADA